MTNQNQPKPVRLDVDELKKNKSANPDDPNYSPSLACILVGESIVKSIAEALKLSDD